jgi:hypothetical protein
MLALACLLCSPYGAVSSGVGEDISRWLMLVAAAVPLCLHHILPDWETPAEGQQHTREAGVQRDYGDIGLGGPSARLPLLYIISTVLSLPLLDPTSNSVNMLRTAARSFAASAWRSAESVSQLEAAHQTAIGISKAQGIGQRGFLDGKT